MTRVSHNNNKPKCRLIVEKEILKVLKENMNKIFY